MNHIIQIIFKISDFLYLLAFAISIFSLRNAVLRLLDSLRETSSVMLVANFRKNYKSEVLWAGLKALWSIRPGWIKWPTHNREEPEKSDSCIQPHFEAEYAMLKIIQKTSNHPFHTHPDQMISFGHCITWSMLSAHFALWAFALTCIKILTHVALWFV